MRFGVFLAPYHEPGENPTLALERDLELIVRLDELGYDEAWVGEHHSTGWETIASPEIVLAVAAERTRHIRLGTGVVSLPYHHPLMVADRIVLLDHLTRGRINFGVGPGGHLTDARMLGIDPGAAAAADGRGARRDRAPAHRDRADHAWRATGSRSPTPCSSCAPTSGRTRRSRSPAWSRPPAWCSPAATARACSRSASPAARAGRSTSPPSGARPRRRPSGPGARSTARTGASSMPVHVAETRERGDRRDPRAARRPSSSTTPRPSPAGRARCRGRASGSWSRWSSWGPGSSAPPTTSSRPSSGSRSARAASGGLMITATEWAPRESVLRSYELIARHVMPRFQGSLDGHRGLQRRRAGAGDDHRRAAGGRRRGRPGRLRARARHAAPEPNVLLGVDQLPLAAPGELAQLGPGAEGTQGRAVTGHRAASGRCRRRARTARPAASGTGGCARRADRCEPASLVAETGTPSGIRSTASWRARA